MQQAIVGTIAYAFLAALALGFFVRSFPIIGLIVGTLGTLFIFSLPWMQVLGMKVQLLCLAALWITCFAVAVLFTLADKGEAELLEEQRKHK